MSTTYLKNLLVALKKTINDDIKDGDYTTCELSIDISLKMLNNLTTELLKDGDDLPNIIWLIEKTNFSRKWDKCGNLE
jgi:hypothetical protein